MIVDQPGLEHLAHQVAAALTTGDVLLLSGEMGAGKTTFARALLRFACGDPAMEVPSPSYTLVQSYPAPKFILHHFDLWRLDGPASLIELGWDNAREGVCLVEWPDRLGSLTPRRATRVHFTLISETLRDVTLEQANE